SLPTLQSIFIVATGAGVDAADGPAAYEVQRTAAARRVLPARARTRSASAGRDFGGLYDFRAALVERRNEWLRARRNQGANSGDGLRREPPPGQRRLLAGDEHSLAAGTVFRSTRQRTVDARRYRERNDGPPVLARRERRWASFPN